MLLSRLRIRGKLTLLVMIPPSPAVMFLLAWNENEPMWPIAPTV